MSTYVIGLVASIGIFLFTFEILRRGLIRERFAVVWISTSGLMLFFAAYNDALTWISRVLSFETPSNLLFFFSIVLLIAVSLQFSVELGKLEQQNRKMAIEIALIKSEIKKKSD